MISYLKRFIDKNWKSILGFLGGIVLWILIKENIFNLSYPLWGYLVFGGIDFDGVDDFVNFGASTGVEPGTGDFSVAFWWNGGGGINEVFIGNRNNGAVGTQAGWSIFNGNPATIFVLLESSINTYKLYQGSNLTGTGWVFFVFTWKNSTDTLILYENGLPITPSKLFDTNLTGRDITVANNLNLSRNPNSAGYFDGIINEVAAWNSVLTPGEVLSLYKSRLKYLPLYIQSSNLLIYAPMDDGIDGTSADGDTVRDISGNGNNGTGDDGGNNTGLIWKAEQILSYPHEPILVRSSLGLFSLSDFQSHVLQKGIRETIQIGIR